MIRTLDLLHAYDGGVRFEITELQENEPVVAGLTDRSFPSAVAGLERRPPALVPWWTMVAPSRALRRGGIRRFDFGDIPLVLFRGRSDGVVRAITAHCLHQGVDLSRGSVVGDALRCPLHYWEYTGCSVKIPGSARVPPPLPAMWTAVERDGMIFLCPGTAPPDPPSFRTMAHEDLYFLEGPPVELDCPWFVPVANAFDMTHLNTVHHRQLTREPVVSSPDRMTFVLEYSTEVTGDSVSDRIMRALSNNHIDATVTCSGTMVIIEARAGRHRSYMMVSLRPTAAGGVSFLPLYAVPRDRAGLHVVRARAARTLFNAFLMRDVDALRGIRFPEQYVDARDETINSCYRHLCQLPEYRNGEHLSEER